MWGKMASQMGGMVLIVLVWSAWVIVGAPLIAASIRAYFGPHGWSVAAGAAVAAAVGTWAAILQPSRP